MCMLQDISAGLCVTCNRRINGLVTFNEFHTSQSSSVQICTVTQCLVKVPQTLPELMDRLGSYVMAQKGRAFPPSILIRLNATSHAS